MPPALKWLFDTDHVSLHERGFPGLRNKLEAAEPGSIATSVVAVEEMLRGRLAVLARRSAGDARVRAYEKFFESVRFFSSIPVVPFDLACEQKFQELRAQGVRVGSQDLKIASTALANDLVLVTRNTRDFMKIPRLSVEDWSLD